MNKARGGQDVGSELLDFWDVARARNSAGRLDNVLSLSVSLCVAVSNS